MRKVHVDKFCDITGEPGAETLTFAFGGYWWEIDLNSALHQEKSEFLEELAEQGRRIGRAYTPLETAGAGGRRNRNTPARRAAMRSWWRDHQEMVERETGHQFRELGTFPGKVEALYDYNRKHGQNGQNVQNAE